MGASGKWKEIWEGSSGTSISDFELDRGRREVSEDTEAFAIRELIEFIDPQPSETLVDAGCGSGMNIVHLYSRVKSIIGFDYSWGSVQRCQRRIRDCSIPNAHVCHANIGTIPLPDRSVDKILCLSVLQYLDENEVRQVLHEFVRVLRPEGTLVLHVKNLASLYWPTLLIAKRLKTLLGGATNTYRVRPYAWYVNELATLNCRILDYNSFNLLALDLMPHWLTTFLRKWELNNYDRPLFRIPFVRRHGADLKIKALVQASISQRCRSGAFEHALR